LAGLECISSLCLPIGRGAQGGHPRLKPRRYSSTSKFQNPL
jgi:hypothetical protein